MPPERGSAAGLALFFILISVASTAVGDVSSDAFDPEQQECAPVAFGTNVEPGEPLFFDPSLDAELQSHLKDPKYRFCQDKRYRLFRKEKLSICSDLSVFAERCPGLAAACTRPAWEEDYEDEHSAPEDLFDFKGEWLLALVKGIFWLALAVGLFFIIRALLRHLRALAPGESRARHAALAPASVEPTSEAHDLPIDELLQLAAQKLDEGRIHESLQLNYRATVRKLGLLGWVKPHRSLTSGDYLRTLSRTGLSPPLPAEAVAASQESSGEFQAHLRQLDRARFGALPGPEQARELLGRTRQLAQHGLQVLVLFLSLGAGGCQQQGSPEPPHAKAGPRGHQLIFDLLAERSLSTHRRVLPVSGLPEDTTTVLALGAQLKSQEWQVLKTWTSAGGHLVVADPPPNFDEVFDRTIGRSTCRSLLKAPDLKLTTFDVVGVFEQNHEGESLATCNGDSHAQTQMFGDGWLTTVADTTLFENVSVAASDNAALALYIVGDVDGHLEFLGPWTGAGAMSPFASIVRGGFDFWVLHLFFLAALYLWAQGRRPGKPISDRPVERRSFVEHARALSRRYRNQKASGWALERYADWTLEVLRRRVPSGRSDLKSLCRSVTESDRAAASLRQTLTAARKASELGGSSVSHQAAFRNLQTVLLQARSTQAKNQDRI